VIPVEMKYEQLNCSIGYGTVLHLEIVSSDVHQPKNHPRWHPQTICDFHSVAMSI
jgi:hypothetical protein